MKKRLLLPIVCLAIVVLLFSGCENSNTLKLDPPVADPAGQLYNSLNKSLPLSLEVDETRTVKAAVQAEVVTGEGIEAEALEHMNWEETKKRWERLGAIVTFEPEDGMCWYRCRVVVVPLEEIDLNKARISQFCGRVVDEKKGYLTIGAIINDTNYQMWSQFCVFREEGGPALFIDNLEVKGSGKEQYYEVTIYAYLPDNDSSFAFGVTNKMVNNLDVTLPDLTDESVLCWEINGAE